MDRNIEEHVEIMRDGLVDMGMSETGEVKWFKQGGYQIGTPRRCKSIC